MKFLEIQQLGDFLQIKGSEFVNMISFGCTQNLNKVKSDLSFSNIKGDTYLNKSIIFRGKFNKNLFATGISEYFKQ